MQSGKRTAAAAAWAATATPTQTAAVTAAGAATAQVPRSTAAHRPGASPQRWHKSQRLPSEQAGTELSACRGSCFHVNCVAEAMCRVQFQPCCFPVVSAQVLTSFLETSARAPVRARLRATIPVVARRLRKRKLAARRGGLEKRAVGAAAAEAQLRASASLQDVASAAAAQGDSDVEARNPTSRRKRQRQHRCTPGAAASECKVATC